MRVPGRQQRRRGRQQEGGWPGDDQLCKQHVERFGHVGIPQLRHVRGREDEARKGHSGDDEMQDSAASGVESGRHQVRIAIAEEQDDGEEAQGGGPDAWSSAKHRQHQPPGDQLEREQQERRQADRRDEQSARAKEPRNRAVGQGQRIAQGRSLYRTACARPPRPWRWRACSPRRVALGAWRSARGPRRVALGPRPSARGLRFARGARYDRWAWSGWPSCALHADLGQVRGGTCRDLAWYARP